MGNSERTKVQDRLFRDSARFILGEATTVRLKGRPEALEALREVLSASRDLYQALEKGQPLEEVRSHVARKSLAAERFQRVTGLQWRL